LRRSGLDLEYRYNIHIWQPDAELHAEYNDVVRIKTGSLIPIWRTFVFQTGSSCNSDVD